MVTKVKGWICLNACEEAFCLMKNNGLSIKLNRSISDLIDACHPALFMDQYLPFNGEHFYVYFMVVFEQFLFRGMHECIFTIDNARFHNTNRVQIMMQENGRRVIYLSPYSPFLYAIENFL
ncbi:hypothetical protein RF11_06006 [Thelohanellus kitauei]|uniref:Tc1-like transposase DDE domain-containing protein n=1 Tax=Thelohanellus kitauei TaxID=669202 RepID=A0A0C2I6H9_THEKT|nr:hypothetical protein RF11_06006 [Thelohanellus kitauei]